jgi:hypothetical protein
MRHVMCRLMCIWWTRIHSVYLRGGWVGGVGAAGSCWAWRQAIKNPATRAGLLLGAAGLDIEAAL